MSTVTGIGSQSYSDFENRYVVLTSGVVGAVASWEADKLSSGWGKASSTGDGDLSTLRVHLL